MNKTIKHSINIDQDKLLNNGHLSVEAQNVVVLIEQELAIGNNLLILETITSCLNMHIPTENISDISLFLYYQNKIQFNFLGQVTLSNKQVVEFSLIIAKQERANPALNAEYRNLSEIFLAQPDLVVRPLKIASWSDRTVYTREWYPNHSNLYYNFSEDVAENGLYFLTNGKREFLPLNKQKQVLEEMIQILFSLYDQTKKSMLYPFEVPAGDWLIDTSCDPLELRLSSVKSLATTTPLNLLFRLQFYAYVEKPYVIFPFDLKVIANGIGKAMVNKFHMNAENATNATKQLMNNYHKAFVDGKFDEQMNRFKAQITPDLITIIRQSESGNYIQVKL